jgi:hypothetical protein
VDTPYQRERHIADSPDLAIRDFLTHGVQTRIGSVSMRGIPSARSMTGLRRWAFAGAAFSRACRVTPSSVSTKRRGVGSDSSAPSTRSVCVGRTFASSGTPRSRRCSLRMVRSAACVGSASAAG